MNYTRVRIFQTDQQKPMKSAVRMVLGRGNNRMHHPKKTRIPIPIAHKTGATLDGVSMKSLSIVCRSCSSNMPGVEISPSTINDAIAFQLRSSKAAPCPPFIYRISLRELFPLSFLKPSKPALPRSWILNSSIAFGRKDRKSVV